MSTLDISAERHDARERKTQARVGLAGTDGGHNLIDHYYDETVSNAEQKLERLRAVRNTGAKKAELLSLGAEKLAYASLYYGLCSIAHDSPTIAHACRTIGKGLETECYGQALYLWDEAEAAKLEKIVKSTHGSLAYRKRALFAHARKAKFRFEEWDDPARLASGREGLEVLLAGSLFVLDGDYLTITEEARETLDGLMASLLLRNLICLPQTGPVVPWDSTTLHLDNAPYQLVRTHQKPVRRFVASHIADGTMAKPLAALNHAQSVMWRVNAPMRELVRACYERGIGVPGVPPKDDLPPPPKEKPWDDMSEGERRAWRKKANDIATYNRGLIGERIVFARDIAMADHLDGKPFWTPMNFDYRGRVYGIPHYNYQRSDVVRCQFEFVEGQTLTEDGLYWLKVHAANCGDFDKISKDTFDARVKWTNANLLRMLETAHAPLNDLWWTQADKPMMFVAACKALNDHYDDKPVHLPINFDGSCNGLQNLCLMAMADKKESSLVNLTPTDKPNDIYQTVADIVRRKIEADVGGENNDIARICLANGITRSLVKRNVMTYSYSSKRYGMSNQLLEDTMRPLDLKVLSGELEAHPYGDDGGYVAARYLSHHTFSAIEEAISKPAEVMRFLQGIARVCAHESKPVTWVTPVGFPVMLRYPQTDYKRVELFLLDKSIKRRVQAMTALEISGIDKSRAANAIAPSFTHSMDSAHLQMVVLACKDVGINSISLVHDSFGCLPNDAPVMRQIILETMRDLYSRNDVLQDILDHAERSLETNAHKLPSVPRKGTLDINQVTWAEYAFS